jgi:hypothetical protein
MGNINGRLAKLESHTGVPEVVIAVNPGETEQQAQERHFAEHPEHRGARREILVYIRNVYPET